MESTKRNTRRHERFRSGVGSNITLATLDGKFTLLAQLLDLNQAGGLGLFIILEGEILRLPVHRFFEPWRMTRHSQAREVKLDVELQTITQRVMQSRQGLRISAHTRDTTDHARPGVAIPRRHSPRRLLPPRRALLTRMNDVMNGEVRDASPSGGVGVHVPLQRLSRALTCGALFATGWRLVVTENTFPFVLRRLSRFGEMAILGGEAAGGGAFFCED